MTINQLQLFIIFLIDGIIIGVIFDIFRILRKTFKHKDYIIYIQDILFWFITGLILLYSTFVFNAGELRAFMIVSSVLGFFIYLFTLSKIFIKINVKIILLIKKIVIQILRIIAIPIKKLIALFRKLFMKPVTFLVINLKKTIKGVKMSKNKKNNNKQHIKEGF